MGNSDSRPSIKSSPLNPINFPCMRDDTGIITQRQIGCKEIDVQNFIFKKTIGRSKFGTVWLVMKMPQMELMVLKVMEKATINRNRCIDTVMNERELLSTLMHPFICNLKYAF